MLKFLVVAGVVLASGWGMVGVGSAQEPAWYPAVIAPPEMRAQLQALPPEARPYRPLHFWGNTVRRVYFRGNPLPTPQDVFRSGELLLAPRVRGSAFPGGGRFMGVR